MNEKEKVIMHLTCDASMLYEVLADSTDEYVWVCNPNEGIIRYPAKMLEEFALPGEVVKDPLIYWKDIIHPDDWDKFRITNELSFSGKLPYHIVEYRAKNRKGEWVWLQCRGIAVPGKDADVPSLFAGYISNLGRRNKIDNHTGLFNQYEFHKQINNWLKEKKYPSFAIMMLGIDNFKNINELYDRVLGDQILREIAQKLQSLLFYDAEIYRLDGDVFGILMKEADVAKVKQLFVHIQSRFSSQQYYKGVKYYCTFSAGACIAPQDGETFAILYQCLENAMNYAKRHGKNRLILYSEKIAHENNRIFEMMELLRESIECDFRDFYLMYQPQISTKDNKIKGVEALLRWHNEKYPNVGPAEFVPILEESGLIDVVGRWVLKQACLTCKEWNQYDSELKMSVNISYKQIFPIVDAKDDIFTYVTNILKEVQVDPNNLVLEFTESSFAPDVEYLKQKMQEMRELGVGIAIDDFGVGYSSLGLLKGTPVNVVKLDKVFVDGITDTNFDANFIRFVSELCHSTNIQLVQEGVETESQCQLIQQLGPDYIQGFYFDRPKKKEEIFECYIAPLKHP